MIPKLKPSKYCITMLLIVFFSSCSTMVPDYPGLDVLELSNKKFTWLIEQNFDSLEVLLDDRVKYIHSNGLVETKEDVIANMQSGKLQLNKVILHDAEVRHYDNLAIIIGKGNFVGIIDGVNFNVELLYTEVYTSNKGSWKLVSRHANRLP
jgi:hypothetical protein